MSLINFGMYVKQTWSEHNSNT